MPSWECLAVRERLRMQCGRTRLGRAGEGEADRAHPSPDAPLGRRTALPSLSQEKLRGRDVRVPSAGVTGEKAIFGVPAYPRRKGQILTLRALRTRNPLARGTLCPPRSCITTIAGLALVLQFPSLAQRARQCLHWRQWAAQGDGRLHTPPQVLPWAGPGCHPGSGQEPRLEGQAQAP